MLLFQLKFRILDIWDPVEELADYNQRVIKGRIISSVDAESSLDEFRIPIKEKLVIERFL
jgi:hypothetical protein